MRSNARKGRPVRRTKDSQSNEHPVADPILHPSVRICVIRACFLRPNYTDLLGPKQIHQGEMTMKTLRLTLLLGMLFTTFNLLAQSTPQKSFDVMKSLAGNWEGKTTMGDPVSVSYRLTS